MELKAFFDLDSVLDKTSALSKCEEACLLALLAALLFFSGLGSYLPSASLSAFSSLSSASLSADSQVPSESAYAAFSFRTSKGFSGDLDRVQDPIPRTV